MSIGFGQFLWPCQHAEEHTVCKSPGSAQGHPFLSPRLRLTELLKQTILQIDLLTVKLQHGSQLTWDRNYFSPYNQFYIKLLSLRLTPEANRFWKVFSCWFGYVHVTTSFYWDCWWGVSFPPKFGWTNLKRQILCIETHSFTNQQLLFLSYRPGSAETFMATAWADRHRGEWGSPPSPASPLPLHDSLTPLLSSPFISLLRIPSCPD